MPEDNSIAPSEPSRRSIMLGGGALLAGLAILGCQRKGETCAASDADTRLHTSLHQDESFNASPERVYGVLLSSSEFAAFTGQKAQIDPVVGGAFSLFGGQVVGMNLDLVPNQRIVQAWRAIGDWPPGIFSIVHFALTPTATGTALALDHTGFRPGDFGHLNAGWPPNYWTPMKRYFAARG